LCREVINMPSNYVLYKILPIYQCTYTRTWRPWYRLINLSGMLPYESWYIGYQCKSRSKMCCYVLCLLLFMPTSLLASTYVKKGVEFCPFPPPPQFLVDWSASQKMGSTPMSLNVRFSHIFSSLHFSSKLFQTNFSAWIGTGFFPPEIKAAGAWSWPRTSI
jgi:hypothetical protein